MDANPISCPVCTLYLRPGITLKTHLSSHPKQKVIEALCRLSSGSEDIPKLENSSSSQSELCSAITQSQVNTAILNQSWNHQQNLVNMPSPSVPPLGQGNHVFIYQQSMSSSTSSPQQNVLNVNPLSQQYVIPTVLNSQMMPYIYQQQQVIMSSNSACLSPIRNLPTELPPSTATSDSGIQEQTTDCSITGDEVSIIEEVDEVAQNVEKTEENLFDSVIDVTENNVKEDLENGERAELEELELKDAEVEVISEEPYENPDNNYDDAEVIIGSPCSPEESFKSESELNKACQTQNSENSNEEESILPDDGDAELEESLSKNENDYYFGANNQDNNPAPYSSTIEMQQTFESNPIYTSSNILHQASSDQFDFVEMDGMHVVINDMNEFSSGPIISQVENFDSSVPERPGVLMTIGGMIDKDDFVEHRDESMSRESSNVNIRADERMPPRGELSGQESIGGSSDITWHRVTYTEGTSAMSTSYDLLGRESWDASDNSSDAADVPPLQSRILPHVIYPEENHTLTSFKCGSCCESFSTIEDRDEHEGEKHPGIVAACNKRKRIIMNRKKVKKLIVKPKQDKPETVNNFDNVFTNKLKMETESDIAPEEKPDDQITIKTDETSPPVEVKAVCPICECVLLNAKALKEHKYTVHNITSQTRHKCMTCDEQFPNDYKFSEHLRIHPLECKICGRLFYRRQNIQLHMRRHLGIKPYKCEVCEKSFLTKQKLDEHRNIHTGDAPIKCNLCDETFRRHSNLVQHRNRHHLNVKKKLKDYICSCKEVFHSKKKLAWHKEIHDAKPKSCTQCNEKFIHMSSLTRHMRRAHNDKFLPNDERNNENVVCPICNGVYLKSSLEVHIRNHSGQRPYSCLICNKDFTTKWNLKLHKWTHASRVSKPFKCDQCKGAFIREADYTAHMNSHKSIRPYTCNYCGAQFIRKYNCQRHVKEHENEKMFNCKVCGKTFHRSYYLKDHMRIHSGARPFSCHICGKTSTTKSNHNKHVQIHHAREPVSTEN